MASIMESFKKVLNPGFLLPVLLIALLAIKMDRANTFGIRKLTGA